MFLVNSIDGALETTEEGLRTEECRGKVDCIGKFIDYLICRISKIERQNNVKGMLRTIFQHLIKVLQMFHNHITMFFKNRKRNEKVKVTAQPVGPETFP